MSNWPIGKLPKGGARTEVLAGSTTALAPEARRLTSRTHGSSCRLGREKTMCRHLTNNTSVALGDVSIGSSPMPARHGCPIAPVDGVGRTPSTSSVSASQCPVRVISGWRHSVVLHMGSLTLSEYCEREHMPRGGMSDGQDRPTYPSFEHLGR